MKSFLNFLGEVALLNTTSKKEGASMLGGEHRWVGKRKPKLNWSKDKKSYKTEDGDTFHHVSTHPKTGHKIFASHYGGTSAYHAHDPKEHGKIDIAVTATTKKHKNGMKSHDIKTLVGRTGSKLKAHHLYQHLATHPKHKVIFTTKAQTHGGSGVWKKLGKHISIHGKGGEDVDPRKSDDHEDIYHHQNKGANDPMPDHKKPKGLVAYAKKWDKLK